jgi:hypothetical protein
VAPKVFERALNESRGGTLFAVANSLPGSLGSSNT